MSLRTRLFVTYTLVVVTCLSLFALAIAIILQGYRDRLIQAKLGDMALPISIQAASMIRGQITVQELWANLEEQAQKNNVYILLGNVDGEIVRQITPSGEEIKTPIRGFPQGITTATQGTFIGAPGKAFVYTAYPIDKLRGNPLATSLVIAMPRSGAVVILASIIPPFIFAGLIALVVSLVFAVLLARSIYKPISKVTEAANRLAQGKYDEKVPEDGPAEVKGLAVSFNKMAERVRESQEHLRQFVADVSHQLKTPLTSIQGFSQAIVDGTANDDADRLRAARVINEESRRMRRQVEELLELARMQSGQLKMASAFVDVGGLLGYCREILETQAQDKFISIRLDIKPDVAAMGDADRLEQVFCNLLDNAIKNSPPRGEIIISGQTNVDGLAEIRVIDKGPGIPPDQIDGLFQRFHQGNSEKPGFGLGLAIAKEIVHSHGGKIEVRSTVGEGTEFIVLLKGAVRQQD